MTVAANYLDVPDRELSDAREGPLNTRDSRAGIKDMMEDWVYDPDFQDHAFIQATLKDYSLAVQDHGAVSGLLTLDCRDGNVHTLSLAGDLTLAIAEAPACGFVKLIITRPAASLITWPSSVEHQNGVDPFTLYPEYGATTVFQVTLFTANTGARWYIIGVSYTE